MNEELDDAAVTAAVAGYPRTGRDLADGYMLAALAIRATYDPDDPEIARTLRLYGDSERLDALGTALHHLERRINGETYRRRRLDAEADRRVAGRYAEHVYADRTVELPRVPGEMTQEIRRPIDPESPLEWDHPYAPSTLKWSEACAFLLPRQSGDPVTACGLPQDHPVHHFPRAALTPLA